MCVYPMDIHNGSTAACGVSLQGTPKTGASGCATRGDLILKFYPRNFPEEAFYNA